MRVAESDQISTSCSNSETSSLSKEARKFDSSAATGQGSQVHMHLPAVAFASHQYWSNPGHSRCSPTKHRPPSNCICSTSRKGVDTKSSQKRCWQLKVHFAGTDAVCNLTKLFGTTSHTWPANGRPAVECRPVDDRRLVVGKFMICNLGAVTKASAPCCSNSMRLRN